MNDQAAGLRAKIEQGVSKRQAKTISVISGKGGVGKSNIALNFSLSLRSQGKKVIILDLDVGMGNINILLGLQSRKTIVDLFNEKLSVHEVIETGPGDLNYISGGSGLTEFLLLNEEKKAYFFEQYNQLVEMYDYIIFDMGAGVTYNSLFFILASDEAILITTPEPTSITDAYSMMKQVVNYRKDLPIYLILNRATGKQEGTLTLERFQKAAQQFLNVQIKILGLLPEDRAVTDAVLEQKPFLLLNNRSKAAKATHHITQNYLSGLNYESEKQRGNNSFLIRLKQLLRGK